MTTAEQVRTRAKFRCNSMTHVGPCSTSTDDPPNPRTYHFAAEYDTSIPEDTRYARYTPSGQLTITVDNPRVTFHPGRSYYLDFIPVD